MRERYFSYSNSYFVGRMTLLNAGYVAEHHRCGSLDN